LPLAGLVAPSAVRALVSPPARVGTPSQPLAASSETLAGRSPWSRPESYPLTEKPRADLYRPSADWIGRLILPTPQEAAAPEAPPQDWVWIEIEQAPAAQGSLIGQRLRLRWAERPELRRLVRSVTTTIRLGEEALQAAAQGNVVPTRLDGRRVGPLQSLAGARPSDDLTVLLEGVTPEPGGLRISRPPVQITGRWQGLVTVLGPADGPDLWRVRHFARDRGGFAGAEETIRIPALPPDRYGRRLIDPAGLAGSPWNAKGWLIQGAPAADGVFTVQALLPYGLLQLSPSRVVNGTDPALAHVRHRSWSPPQMRRGSLTSTALIPDGQAPPAWGVGERALLMHLFGGIGGEDGEPVAGWTVTGHFAFGEAEVVRDASSGAPRLALRYHQIYANNPNGIVAGSQDWSAYAGSLQRGWIGLRPFADVLVPIGGAVLDAIDLQAELLAARYRSGDGGGVALVTPSTSCVQDSGQALWIAIRQLRLAGDQVPMSALDRQRLHHLGLAFDRLLEPFGRVRSDWYSNAASALAVGTGSVAKGSDPFVASQSLQDALLSWRSLLPRSAHDLFAAEFLRVGLPLLELRTNQIPGADPRLLPVAPTALFGALPLVSILLGRLGDGLFPLWQPLGQVASVAILLAYVAIAANLARPRLGRRQRPRLGQLPRAARLLVLPAFGEELLFRGLLLPSALDGVKPLAMLPWMALSVGLFVAWQGRMALWLAGDRRERLPDPQLLLQSTLLGVACSLIYAVSGSLWWAVLLHWLAVLFRWQAAGVAGQAGR
jgi:predicted Abi (CAAX) family protease